MIPISQKCLDPQMTLSVQYVIINQEIYYEKFNITAKKNGQHAVSVRLEPRQQQQQQVELFNKFP